MNHSCVCQSIVRCLEEIKIGRSMGRMKHEFIKRELTGLFFSEPDDTLQMNLVLIMIKIISNQDYVGYMSLGILEKIVSSYYSAIYDPLSVVQCTSLLIKALKSTNIEFGSSHYEELINMYDNLWL